MLAGRTREAGWGLQTTAIKNDSSAILSDGRGFAETVNAVSMGRALPSVTLVFESSASASSATPAIEILNLQARPQSSTTRPVSAFFSAKPQQSRLELGLCLSD